MTSDYSSESIRELYERNFDTLYRVCYMYMKNIQDTEDAVHNAFLKAIETRKQFESENHEKSAKKTACLRAFAKTDGFQSPNQANAIIPESHAAAH